MRMLSDIVKRRSFRANV